MRVARYVTGVRNGSGYGWARTSDGDRLPFAPRINMGDLCGCRTDVSGRVDLPVIELMADNGNMDRWVITQSQYVTCRVSENGSRTNVPAYRFAQSFFCEGESRRAEALCMPQAIAEKCLSVADYQRISEQNAPFPAVEISLNVPQCQQIGSLQSEAEAIFVLRIWKNSWARYRGKRFTPIRIVLLPPDQIARTLEAGLKFTAEVLNRMLPDVVKGMISVAIAVPQQYAGGYSRDVLHILYNEPGMGMQSFDYCTGRMTASDDHRNEVERLISDLMRRGQWPDYYRRMLECTDRAEAHASYEVLTALARLEKTEWVTLESVREAWKALSACRVDTESIEEILHDAEICLTGKLDCRADQGAVAVSRFLEAGHDDVARAYLKALQNGIGTDEALRILLKHEFSRRMLEGFSLLTQELAHPMEIGRLERLAEYADKHMGHEEVRSFFQKAFDAYANQLVEKDFSAADFKRFIKAVDKRDERTDNIQRMLAACRADIPAELIQDIAGRLDQEKLWEAVRAHIGRLQNVSPEECVGWMKYIQKKEYAEFLMERMKGGGIGAAQLDAFLEYIEKCLGKVARQEAIICYYNGMPVRTDAVRQSAVKAVKQMIVESEKAGEKAREQNSELYRDALAELFAEKLGNAQSLDAINGIARTQYLSDEAYREAFGDGAPECCLAPEYLDRLIGNERTFEKAERLFDDLDKSPSYPVLSAGIKAALSEWISGEYCVNAARALLSGDQDASKAAERFEHYQKKLGLKETEQVKQCRDAAAWVSILLSGDADRMYGAQGRSEWAALILRPEMLLKGIGESEAFHVAAALLAEVSEGDFFDEYLQMIRKSRGEDPSEEALIAYTGRVVLKGELRERLFRRFCESAKGRNAWRRLERELKNPLKGKRLEKWFQADETQAERG